MNSICKKLTNIEHLVFPGSEGTLKLILNNYTRVSYSDGSYKWYRSWVELDYLIRATEVSNEELPILELGYTYAGLKK